MTRKATALLVTACSVLAIGIGAAIAQGPGRGPGGMGPGGMGQGQGMMGPGMMGGWGMGPGMHRGMMGYGSMPGGCPMFGSADGRSYATGRLAFLKAELAITDAQKAAWDGYAAALAKNLEGMQAMHETMMKEAGSGTPVERLDRRLTVMESRVTLLKELKPTLAALYGAFSEEQKKKADDLLTGMGCMM